MLHKYLVKDGCGGTLGEFGNPKRARNLAARALGASYDDLRVINDGLTVYWFNGADLTADYWIDALGVKPVFVGKPNI